MRDLPQAIIHVLRHFELAFSEPVWEWATILLVGAILAPGQRTVTAALRVMGLSNVLFIVYGYEAHIHPVLLLHVALLPINLVRVAGLMPRPLRLFHKARLD